jgi:hypothetical protein
MAWFRLHTSVLNNPKIQKLSGESVKTWLNLLCLAKDGDGIIPTIDRVAWALRRTEAQVEKSLAELADLIERYEDGSFQTHEWERHEVRSDVSSERVKAFRGRSRNGSETFHVTAPRVTGNGNETPRARSEQNRADTEQIQTPETALAPQPTNPDSKESKAKRKRQLDPNMRTPEWDAYAASAEYRWPQARIDREFLKFCDHHAQKGTLGLDWLAGWRTWVRNGHGFNPEPEPVPALFQAPPKPAIDPNSIEGYALQMMTDTLLASKDGVTIALPIAKKLADGKIGPEREAELWAMARKAAA